MFSDWDRPLRWRWGGTSRLAGLRVYYVFDWRAMFHHDRATFPLGQSLAELVSQDCPTGKAPALLLTENTSVTVGIRETDDEYIVVVPIHDYLSKASGDAASTYYARLFSKPLTQLASLADVAFSSPELEQFLDDNLTTQLVSSWIGRSPDPDSLMGEIDTGQRIKDRVLAELLSGDPTLREELEARLEASGDDTSLRALLFGLTKLRQGREIAAGVLRDRLVDRIADTRARLQEYDALVGEATTSETDVQAFLEANPWIVGLPYVSARHRVEIPRGVLDFVLDRFDGFFDLVELKGPHEQIVVESAPTDTSRPPSASKYALGPALSRALAQAHHYRALLDQTGGLGSQYGLADTRQPRILVLVGRSDSLSPSSQEILRQLNLTLHRVEVVPYDVLGTRTSGLLRNVEALWSASDS